MATNLRLNDLRHVMLLSEHRSFTRAADAAGISQSAMSQSISSLEARLGTRLFIRSKSRVLPTEKAEVMARRARAVFAAMDDLESAIESDTASSGQPVRIGVGVLPCELLLSHTLAMFARSHPTQIIQCEVGYVDDLHEKLLARSIDFYVGGWSTKLDHSFTSVTQLLAEPLVLAARPDHPLLARQTRRFADLLEYPTITYDLGRGVVPYFRYVESNAELKQLELRFPAIKLSHPLMMVDLARETEYLILASRHVLRHCLASNVLVEVEIEELNIESPIAIVRVGDAALSPSAHEMIRLFEETAASLGSDDRISASNSPRD